MPTGYTSEIYNGQEVSGKEFLMKCARAFGACVEMRDAGMDALIPEEFKPSTYHAEEIEKVRIKLIEYQNMTNEEIKQAIEYEYNSKIKYNKEKIEEYKQMKNRYLKTLQEIEIWTPPTPDHIGLKKFAIEQIKKSIEFDCNYSYYEKEEIKKPISEEWINNKINKCEEDIKYHTKKNEEEIKRIEERNKWIKDLRESLK